MTEANRNLYTSMGFGKSGCTQNFEMFLTIFNKNNIPDDTIIKYNDYDR